YLIEKRGIDLSDADYAADVTFRLRVVSDISDVIEKEITEVTAGRCLITRLGECKIVERIKQL
ncbi:MAG: DUF1949 domain-containing protein, partial [Lachnospiraceae bacterium]|nr:DUF1949 domain-containing protein [Lachnospiraceae bacterium]